MEEVEDLAGASVVAFLEGAGPIICSSSFVPCGDHWKGREGLHQCHFPCGLLEPGVILSLFGWGWVSAWIE